VKQNEPRVNVAQKRAGLRQSRQIVENAFPEREETGKTRRGRQDSKTHTNNEGGQLTPGPGGIPETRCLSFS